jgi:hypothetical protein
MTRHNQKGFAVIELLLIAVGVLMIAGTGWYVISSKNKTDNLLDKANGTKFAAPSKKTSSAPKPAPGPSSSKSSQPNNAPFSISKVYFAVPPKVVNGGTGPEQSQCKLGDTLTYQATAQVTATNRGTMQYHWEIEDHLGGTIQKLDTQSYSFTAAGTKDITVNLTYPVRETNGAGYFWNRQYVNLVVTVPNSTYANKDQPVYAYKQNQAYFVWGSYVDVC